MALRIWFDGAWQAAEALAQEPHLVVDSLQYGLQGGAASFFYFSDYAVAQRMRINRAPFFGGSVAALRDKVPRATARPSQERVLPSSTRVEACKALLD